MYSTSHSPCCVPTKWIALIIHLSDVATNSTVFTVDVSTTIAEYKPALELVRIVYSAPFTLIVVSLALY